MAAWQEWVRLMQEASPGKTNKQIRTAVWLVPALLALLTAFELSHSAGPSVAQFDPCEQLGAKKPCRLEVPKIIHQVWIKIDPDQKYEEAKLPAQWAGGPRLWKETHSDWEYKLWTDKEIVPFMEEHYAWFLPVFNGYKNPIQRADAVRYFALYHFGGVYVDLDVMPVRNIEPMLLGVEAMLGATPNGGPFGVTATNAFMAAKKGSDFFKWIQTQLEAHKDPWLGRMWRHWEILMSTGPTFLTGILPSYTGPDRVTIMPSTVWGKCSMCQKGCNVVPNGFFHHTKGDSWHKWDSYITTHVCYCHGKFFLLLLWTVVLVAVAGTSWIVVGKMPVDKSTPTADTDAHRTLTRIYASLFVFLWFVN